MSVASACTRYWSQKRHPSVERQSGRTVTDAAIGAGLWNPMHTPTALLMLATGSSPDISTIFSTEARNAPISALCAASVPFEYERSAVASECPISLAATRGAWLLTAQSCFATPHL